MFYSMTLSVKMCYYKLFLLYNMYYGKESGFNANASGDGN
jgi:hypothetical protein